MTKLAHILLAAMTLGACAARLAAGEPDPAAQARLLEKVSPSLVRLEYRVKYDKGDAPTALNLAEMCASCGRVHSEKDLSTYVKEERPIVAAGFLIGAQVAVAKDLLIHPRFIESIAVVQGDERVTATPSALATDRPAAILQLERPLTSARPLRFSADAAPPYFAITGSQKHGRWHARIRPFTPVATLRDDGAWTCPLAAEQLVIDEQARAVTVTFCDAGGGDAWKAAPAAWPTIDHAALTKRLADFDRASAGRLLRVALSFRSPKKTESAYSYGDDEEAATEQNAIGMIVGPRSVLVLSNLKPKVTARLKRVVLHLPGGKTTRAAFEGTLRDYGAFLASTTEDLPAAASLMTAPVESLADHLLLFATVQMKGENRVAYHQHGRIGEFSRRWNNRLFPTINDDEGHWFIFTPDDALACFSIPRRQKISVEERWSSDDYVLLPADRLADILANPAAHTDASNIPLTEEEENRIAWLGVEMQGLSPELARASQVSDRTRDGEIGGMVSYVYPDSPAAKAGIEPGDILLSLHVEGEPKPLDISVEDDDFGGSFPWERWDELPEQYFDQIPKPWPAADSSLAQSLTRLGFGRAFELELFRDGEVKRIAMTVEQSPHHFDSAARHKNKALGITVRNLTYEVNRYFQRTTDEPGLIISKIEPGSKASVAGLKPYEIITHVNDEPVRTVKEFKRRLQNEDTLRLTVKRMTKGRIVRIKLDRKGGDKTSDAAAARESPATTSAPAETKE